MKSRVIYWLLLTTMIYFETSAQSGSENSERPQIKIGDPCPDFSFTELINTQKKKISLFSLRGKAVILDFWNTICFPCIEELPLMDSLQIAFAGKIQIIPVAMQTDKKVQLLFKRLIGLGKLHKDILPCALDTNLCKSFETTNGWLGQHVWIDEKGIIRNFTTGKGFLTMENLNALISNRPLNIASSAFGDSLQALNKTISINWRKPLFFNDSFGVQPLVYSSLTAWNKEIPGHNQDYISIRDFGCRIQESGLPLDQLYRIAYGDTLSVYPFALHNSYSKYWMSPVMETNDTTVFRYDAASGKNLFCYSLQLPAGCKAMDLQAAMRRDLKMYFGHEVNVQRRVMPCWELVSLPGAITKLKTKGGQRDDYSTAYSIDIRNGKMNDLVKGIWLANQKEIIEDKTGIQDYIDISIVAEIKDFPALIGQLNKFGLNLVRVNKEINVIVITDKLADNKSEIGFAGH